MRLPGAPTWPGNRGVTARRERLSRSSLLGCTKCLLTCALGRRISRTSGGTTTQFLSGVDGNVWLEAVGGTTTATYTWGNGLCRKDGEYPMQDGQGNERTVLNSSQTVTGTLNLDAFGNKVGSTGSSGDPYMYGQAAR